MSDTISDLRTHLFDTIRALKDKSAPMDIARAKAIADVAQTIVNSAKVEVDYMKVVGSDNDLPFLQVAERKKDDAPRPPGILGTTVHRIKG